VHYCETVRRESDAGGLCCCRRRDRCYSVAEGTAISSPELFIVNEAVLDIFQMSRRATYISSPTTITSRRADSARLVCVRVV